MIETTREDTTQELGKRTVEEGLKTANGLAGLYPFEGNMLRPLHKVLNSERQWILEKGKFELPNLNPENDLDWPEDAVGVVFGLATVHWDFLTDHIQSCYGEEVMLSKTAGTQTVQLITAQPTGGLVQLSFLFIGFLSQHRNKYQLLKRKFNTVTLINAIRL